ncbi:unnamed protein product, partial [Polarella glacialis]
MNGSYTCQERACSKDSKGVEFTDQGLGSRLWREFRAQARPGLLVPATLISMSRGATSALRASLSGRLLDTAINARAASGASDALAEFAPLAALYFVAALYGYVANVVE